MLAAGMLANDVRCYPVDRALELADKLIKLHYDNLRHSVREIRENKNTDKDGN